MNRVLAAARLEAWVMKPSYPALGVVLAVAAAVSLVGRLPGLFGTAVLIMAGMLAMAVFSVHDDNRTSKLYGFVPLRRRDVVAGRYLYATALGAIATTVNLAASSLGYAVTDEPALLTAGAVSAAGVWLGFALAITVAYPLYFLLGFSKAMFVIPVFMMAGLVAMVAPTLSEDTALDTLLGWMLDNPALTVAAAGALGLAALTVSALLSTAVYQRKQLT